MTDVATLALAIDATQVDKATKSLDSLTSAGAKAEAQTSRLAGPSSGVANSARALGMAASSSGDSVGKYADQVRKLRDQMDPLGAVNLRMFDALNKNKELFKAGAIDVGEFGRANSFVKDEAEKAAGKIEAATAAVAHVGGASSVATREIITMFREAGRGAFTRMAGSGSILAQSLGLMPYLLNPVTLGIIALTAGVVGYEYVQAKAKEEQEKFGNSLKVFGNNAGFTSASFEEMAKRIGVATHTSAGANEELLSSLAKSNNLSGTQIETVARAIQNLAKDTGQTTETVTKDFDKMAESPGNFAAEFQKKYGGLITPEQVRFIKALEETGDKQKTLEAALKASTGNIATNAETNTTRIVNAWNHAVTAVENYFTAVVNGEKEQSNRQKANALDEEIATAKKNKHNATYGNLFDGGRGQQAYIDGLEKEKAGLIAKAKIEEDAATKKQTSIREHNESSQTELNLEKQFGSAYDHNIKLKHDLLKLDNDIALAKRFGTSAALAELEANKKQIQEGIRQQDTPDAFKASEHHDKTKKTPKDSVGDHLAKMKEEIAGQNELNTAYLNGKGAELEEGAAKAALVEISGKKYSADRIALEYELQRELAVSKYVGTVEKSLETDKRKLLISANVAQQVANGTLSISKANEEIAIQNALLPIQEAKTIATGAAVQQLTDAIVAKRQAMENEATVKALLNVDAENLALDNQTAIYKAQLDLLGATNLQRQIEIDKIKAKQALEGKGIDPLSKEGQEHINKGTQKSEAENALKEATLLKGFEDNKLSDTLANISASVKDATKDFKTLFGTAGEGFSQLINEATGYAQKQEDINVRLKKSERDNGTASVQFKHDAIKANEELSRNTISHYGSMLSATKNFFDSKSKAYAVLEGVERAYRIFQVASSVIELFTHQQAIAMDTAHTVSSVANSGTRATAHAIEAIAHVFAKIPPPFNFIVAGLVGAALIAAGVKLFGGGGGSGAGAPAAAPVDDGSKNLSSGMVSPYSTQAGAGGLYSPGNAGKPGGIIPANDQYYAANSNGGSGGNGGMVIAPVYNIHAPGADAGTVERIQTILDTHQQQTVDMARQAAISDQAAIKNRQRIGGG